MMKRIILLLLISTSIIHLSYAQQNSAYEIQRAKINALLADRSAKFGQYDESLNARTGIFGFQTKGDIKNSNEILRQIALNDNEIFTQLKVLMDYKDLQTEQVRAAASSNSESILNYRKTIKSLQEQNIILTESQEQVENARDLAYLFALVLLVSTAVLGYLFYLKNKRIQQYKKGGVRVG